MERAEAEQIIEAERTRRERAAASQKRWRERRREQERAALRAVGHLEGCTSRVCQIGCLVERFGPPPDGVDE